MAENTSPRDPLPQLIAALQSELQLIHCADVAALRALRPALQRSAAASSVMTPVDMATVGTTQAMGAGFVVGLRIRVGNHYDLQPAITIHDPDLGTLAFVEHVDRDRKTAETDAWKAIERATAVRQILIDEAARQRNTNGRVLPLQVEVVLLVSGAVPSPAPDPVRRCLTTVARQTGYLRLVGLSVLDLEQHPALDADVLRRAFAWLLRGTSQWFTRSTAAVAPSMWRAGEAPLTLTMQDYRLAGTRRFLCRGDSWLNLVHGHNGSGKSSLAEAVELLLTNRIQRLDDADETNYFRIVRHRPFGTKDHELAALGPCSVALGANGSEISKVVLAPGKTLERSGQSPNSGLQTNSFRIDQVFMDKLIRTQAAGRAALFLNAFSPGDVAVLNQLQQLRGDVRASWAQLPEHVRRKAEVETASKQTTAGTTATPAAALREDEMAAFVIREFGALYPVAAPQTDTTTAGSAAAKAVLSPTALEGLLAVGRSELLRLSQIHPPIRERMEALLAVTDPKALPEALAQFESALTTVRSSLPLHIADLTTVLRLFQEFRSWTATHRGPSGDFEADLRRWLELQALLDLTTRYSDVVTTIQGALDRKWTPDAADDLLAAAGRTSGAAGRLAQRRAQLADELSVLRGRVQASSESEGGLPEAAATPTRRWLLPTEIESLNRVDHFLASTRGGEPLGIRFNRALASGREEALADGVIGRVGGLDVAIEEAADMKHACEALMQQTSAPGAATGADQSQIMATLVAKARELEKLSKDLPERFFYRLARGNPQEQNDLAAAFNELLALMTPARWAYRDIRLRADLPDGSPSLGLQTVEGAPADLLFNTAELNASALVLFLLLAPRLPNDLRLLVLDDPLQNMDELTVITLGRALAKLRIVYPKDWTMLALFHGEENIQRIRDEAPCRVYHLPWQQTTPAGDENPIPPVEDDGGLTWQALTTNVIADPPVRATV